MPSTILNSAVFRDIFTTEAMRNVFSDENRVQKYLDFEAALARAQAEAGNHPEGGGRRNRSPLFGRQNRHGETQGSDREDRLPGPARRSATRKAVQGRARRMVALGRNHSGHHRHCDHHADPRGAGPRRKRHRRHLRWSREPREKVPRHAHGRPQQSPAGRADHVRIQDGDDARRLRAPQAASQGAETARAGWRIRRRRGHTVLARQRRPEGSGRADEGAQAGAAGDFMAHGARSHRRGRLLPRPRHRKLRQNRFRRQTADADRSRGGLRTVPCGARVVLDHAAETQPDFVRLHHRADRDGAPACCRAAGCPGGRSRALHRPVGNRMDRAAGNFHVVRRRPLRKRGSSSRACRSTRRKCARTSTSPKG